MCKRRSQWNATRQREMLLKKHQRLPGHLTYGFSRFCLPGKTSNFILLSETLSWLFLRKLSVFNYALLRHPSVCLVPSKREPEVAYNKSQVSNGIGWEYIGKVVVSKSKAHWRPIKLPVRTEGEMAEDLCVCSVFCSFPNVEVWSIVLNWCLYSIFFWFSLYSGCSILSYCN